MAKSNIGLPPVYHWQSVANVPVNTDVLVWDGEVQFTARLITVRPNSSLKGKKYWQLLKTGGGWCIMTRNIVPKLWMHLPSNPVPTIGS